MNPSRPRTLTFFCVVIMLSGLVTIGLAVIGTYGDSDAEYIKWFDAHRAAALYEVTLAYACGAAALFCGYFMLHAKNWARWLYIVAETTCIGLWVWAFLKGDLYSVFPIVREGVIFVLAMLFLFSPNARRFFAAGGLPWWQRPNEGEEEEV